MKKLFIVTLCLLQSLFMFGATQNAKYESEQYSIFVKYNDEITPGNAIFVRMRIVTPKALSVSASNVQKQAKLQLLNGEKVIEEADFYSILGSPKQNSVDMLCGIPCSIWLSDEGNYSVKVVFSPYEGEYKEFILPTKYVDRDFNEEVVELNESNTAIKTNKSTKRTNQINKLNEILFSYDTTAVYSLDKFIPPTNCTRLTSLFGDIRQYKYSNGKSSWGNPHYGNDYGVPEGTEIHSCAKGKVVLAEERVSTGWSIVIEHLPGFYSLYYHLSSMNVKEGDFVQAGELIGLSGKTGLATGPHLHWEIRLNGSAVCPDFFLNDFTFQEN